MEGSGGRYDLFASVITCRVAILRYTRTFKALRIYMRLVVFVEHPMVGSSRLCVIQIVRICLYTSDTELLARSLNPELLIPFRRSGRPGRSAIVLRDGGAYSCKRL